MPFNAQSSQRSAHGLIARWGGVGYIIRDNARRPATMARLEYKPSERGLYVDGSELIRVSAIGLSAEPDFELDTILFKGKIYKINLPVTGPRPNGVPIFYDCNVLYTGPG